MYNYTIQDLQDILDITDKQLCDKLKVTQCRLTKMKLNGLKEDYKHVKAVLIDERVKLIKYLK
jgi:hypothetical protein